MLVLLFLFPDVPPFAMFFHCDTFVTASTSFSRTILAILWLLLTSMAFADVLVFLISFISDDLLDSNYFVRREMSISSERTILNFGGKFYRWGWMEVGSKLFQKVPRFYKSSTVQYQQGGTDRRSCSTLA